MRSVVSVDARYIALDPTGLGGEIGTKNETYPPLDKHA